MDLEPKSRCRSCGGPLAVDQTACPYCGAVSSAPDLEAPRHSLDAETIETDPPDFIPQDAGAISFYSEMPLFTNRFIWKDMAIVTVLSVLGMQLILIVIGFFIGEDLVILPAWALAAAAGILIVLMAFATLVVLMNKYGMTVTVNPTGVSYVAGGRERKLNKVLYVIALLSGKPGAIGSTLLARGQESGRFSWADVHKVTVHPGPRVISLSNSWRVIFRIYCPPENFAAVTSLVQTYASAAAAWRAGQAPAPGWPVKRWVVWTLLALAAAVASAAWGWWIDYDNTSRVLLLGAILVWSAGWFGGLWRRLVGFIAVAVMLYLAAKLGLEALEPATCFDTYLREIPCHSWTRNSGLLALSTAGVLTLLLMSLLRLLGKDPPAPAPPNALDPRS